MQLNENIRRHMVDVENKDEGILYLLSIYHELDVRCISQATIRQVNSTGIVERNLQQGVPKWNAPLYETQNTDDVWSWVDQFRNMFKSANNDRAGTRKTCIARMKKWFAENPEYRKDDVLEATALYLRITDPRYVMKSHKFIYNGAGVMRNSTLSEWIEKVKEREQNNNNTNPNIRMM